MKDPSEKTKLVIRHLPPSLSQSDLFQEIDNRFPGRYNWFSFLPGKSSQKHQRYSQAYIGFNCPEDVFEFAEFFNGHVFVNEKGAQHKAVVEYAPSQRVPKPSTKKDGREGTIYKDPDYLEFLKLIAKPPEHLPSAEIQLERREAEQAGVPKEAPIITPLMEYVRQKRAMESGMQASSVVTKATRRARAASPGKPGARSSKRGSEKKKYIQKDKAKDNRKEKSPFIMMRREDQPATSSTKGNSDIDTGISLTTDSGKKKILLVKGKEREIPHVSESMSQHQSTSSDGNSLVSAAQKQNQRREASGRLIRSILVNNEPRQSHSTASQQKIQILSPENGKRPPRPVNARSGLNGLVSYHEVNSNASESDFKRVSDDKLTKKDLHGLGGTGDKEKRTRNKDRPDRGVWTPLRRSDGSHASNENISSSISNSEPVEVSPGEAKGDATYGGRSGEFPASASGRNSSSVENGSQRHYGRRGASHMKDDGLEGKPSKRVVAGHGAHEKQVWVQKSSSGS